MLTAPTDPALPPACTGRGFSLLSPLSGLLLALGFQTSPVAYAASIGGLATIIGSVPNAIVVAMIPQFFDIEISFLQWMIFALPLTLLLVVLYVYLTRIYSRVPNTRLEVNFVAQELEKLGPQ